jgi:hypothetical protein
MNYFKKNYFWNFPFNNFGQTMSRTSVVKLVEGGCCIQIAKRSMQKVSHVINQKGNANKTTTGCHFTPIRMTAIQQMLRIEKSEPCALLVGM